MTLTGAIGHIEPEAATIPAITSTLERIAASPRDVLTPVGARLPAQCMDGRPFDSPDLPSRRAAEASPASTAPRVAGGTLTTWIVDVLLTGLFRPDLRTSGRAGRRARQPRAAVDDTPLSALDPSQLGRQMRAWAPAWLSLTCASLRAAGLPVSAHADDHASGHNCGCGAVDSVGTILGLLSQRPAGMQQLLASWSVDPDVLPDDVLRRSAAVALTMPDGDDIAGVISGYAGAPLPVMHGPHHEVAALANTVPGTTINTGAVAQALERQLSAAGEQQSSRPQTFCIDVWAFGEIADFLLDQPARAGTADPVTRDQVIATAAAFNAAALLALSAADMPVVVLRG